MSALARWSFRNRFVVIGAWAMVLVFLVVASATLGTRYSNNLSLPGTDSTKALDLLRSSLPAAAGDTDQIVIHVHSGSVVDAGVKARVNRMLGDVRALPSVVAVASPYGTPDTGQVSSDSRTAFATVTFDAQAIEVPVDHVKAVIATARAAAGNGLDIELGGPAITQVAAGAPAGSEAIGLIAAAVILFIAFGSLLGMLIPLTVAIAGVGGGIMTIGLLSHVIGLGSVAPTLAGLVGLGVGIDYALFIVSRYRSGLQAGLGPEDATVRAVNTAGRAVLFAGGTVIVALLGLLVLQIGLLTGLAVSSATTVLITVTAALTLLPALFGVFGFRLVPGKDRGPDVRNDEPRTARSGLWARWSHQVARYRILLSVAVIAIVVVLSLPALALRLGTSDAGSDPPTSTTHKAYDLLAQGFGPGFNGPLLLVATIKSDTDSRAFTDLVARVRATPGVAAVAPAPMQPGTRTGLATVIASTAPQSQATDQLIDRLRADVIRDATRGTTLDVYVGGSTATFKDFAAVLTGRLPLLLAVIVALGCVLLMLAFRSIVIPLTAAVMNVFAASASFGVVVAVFQWGWGAALLGIGRNGPVEAFVPVILLAILFGLSMDYQVFLVSRMHEEWELTHDNARAVSVGQAETARVITAAALIMIFVFGGFALGGQRVIAEFGVSLASAVAIDAFLLRTILVPALMHLFGRANWWLPDWLDRLLPRLHVDGTAEHDQTDGPAPRTPEQQSGSNASQRW